MIPKRVETFDCLFFFRETLFLHWTRLKHHFSCKLCSQLWYLSSIEPTPSRITVYFLSHFCSFFLSFFLSFCLSFLLYICFVLTKGCTRNVFYFTFPRSKTSFSHQFFPMCSQGKLAGTGWSISLKIYMQKVRSILCVLWLVVYIHSRNSCNRIADNYVVYITVTRSCLSHSITISSW